jgi:hypothetical protein
MIETTTDERESLERWGPPFGGVQEQSLLDEDL